MCMWVVITVISGGDNVEDTDSPDEMTPVKTKAKRTERPAWWWHHCKVHWFVTFTCVIL